MAKFPLKRGDIVWVNLQGAVGGEKQGTRPCLVIQNDVGNTVSPLTIIAPITDEKQDKKLPVQVPVQAKDLGDWAKDSVIECGHIRTIDRDSRISKVAGHLSDELMAKVDEAIRVSLGLT